VLEVRIPKPEQRKPRKVSISVGGQDKSEQATIEGTGTTSNGQAEPVGATS
jgi:hypothetical protein